MKTFPKIWLLLLLLISFIGASSQKTLYSISTDFSLLHSFQKDQRYWAMGQTVAWHASFTKKEGFYAWFSYYVNGKFSNDLSATAKDTLAIPRSVNYHNNARLRFSQASLGWKHYWKGSCDAEQGWSLYGYAGFGLLFGTADNAHSIAIDTSRYDVPVLNGKGHFKRLTLDLGLGYEVPAGGDVYFYGEARAFIPTTDYPSRYLFRNENAPLSGALNLGIRILFQ